MTSKTGLAIRHCPLCGVAMQGSKSLENLGDFDTFQCLTCGTSIREEKSRSDESCGATTPKNDVEH